LIGFSRSDRAIAQHCGVDHKTVSKVRSELGKIPSSPQPETRIGRDGDELRQRRSSPQPETFLDAELAKYETMIQKGRNRRRCRRLAGSGRRPMVGVGLGLLVGGTCTLCKFRTDPLDGRMRDPNMPSYQHIALTGLGRRAWSAGGNWSL
jgi:hypothetical protein